MRLELKHGDCLEVLKTIPDNSIDSIVTDPPYGIGFMNKEWDSPEKLRQQQERDLERTKIRKENGTAPVTASFSPFPGQGWKGAKEGKWFQEWCELWGRECLRVLKPGGHLISFSAPRMYHRMTTGLEDAGFDIRDQIMWIYGSGFPKSHNIGKAVDKLLGNEREVVGPSKYNDRRPNPPQSELYKQGGHQEIVTKGQSEWEGWGTALKPANEPICVARKPLSEKTIAENVLRWGTGGINVDGCRIGSDTISQHGRNSKDSDGWNTHWHNDLEKGKTWEGRFPANFIIECTCDEVISGNKGEVKKTNRKRGLTEEWNGHIQKPIEAIDNYNDKGDIHTNPDCPCRILNEQSGDSKSQGGKGKATQKSLDRTDIGYGFKEIDNAAGLGGYADTGGASRFFYVPKVSKKERNIGG